jgi:hypothetical protein
MPGLDPGVHVLVISRKKDVDGRVKPGHDDDGDIDEDRRPQP